MPHDKIHISISERKLYLRVFDVFFVFVGLFIVTSYFNFEYFSFWSPQIQIYSATLIIYLLLFGEIFEIYNLKVASDFYLTFKNLSITVVIAIILYILTPIISPELPKSRLQILFFALTIFVAILLNRLFYIQFIFKPRFFKNILIIGEREYIEKLLSINEIKKDTLIVGYVSNEQIYKNELPYLDISTTNIIDFYNQHPINEIIVSSKNTKFIPRELNNQLIELFKKGVVIRSLDSYIESETQRISETLLSSDFYNYFTFSNTNQNRLYLFFSRFLDILFSLIGIIIFVFIIPIIFIGNLIANRGRLFYTQKRVGKGGKEFNIIKFRTMVKDAEEDGAVWAAKNDTRVTPFGRVLRKTRFDELPQFINVLKGEMSLIGPRPERLEFVNSLGKEIPFYALRHIIKPGLTGWAQVMHLYANSVEDQHRKLLFDLYYIKERSLVLDFKIVIKTISTILFFRGT